VVTSLLCDNIFRGGRCEVGDLGLKWEMSVGIAVKTRRVAFLFDFAYFCKVF
jgi:hypothetical protein